MITRTREVLKFSTPSIRVFGGVLLGGLLTLGTDYCFAQAQHEEPTPQPAEVPFSVEVYQAEEEAEQASWAQYLQKMEDGFRQVEALTLRPIRMVKVWSDFLESFARNNPFSKKDEELRERAEERLAFWREEAQIRGSDTIHAEKPEGGPKDACLDLLESAKQPYVSGDLRLGRVLWNGEIMEPVLIRKTVEDNGAGYRFRDCSDGQPGEMRRVREAEIFNSALVAHFKEESTGVLPTYREVQFLGYRPVGEAKLTFRGAGTMLEARRLDDAHVEVTGTDYGQIAHLERISILLITTRKTMKSMEPEIWDDSWGDRPEDSKIQREIIWWELTSPRHFRIHSTVNKFKDLASLAAGSALETETDWASVLKENLNFLLDRDVLSLLVAEQSDHIELAKEMLNLANMTNNDAELDVGMLGDGLNESAVSRLEEAASRGRYWPFTHPFDLSAIMPDRIAGKIRRNYYQRRTFFDTRDLGTGLANDHVVLATDSPALRAANAMFQDQAARMAITMAFVGCLLDNDTGPSRFDILEEGLKRLSIPSERLEEMDVGKAFRHLFHGFSLPVDLPARERSFLRSLNIGDPDLLRIVRSLQGYLETAALESDDVCKVVLIPDAVLNGEPVEPLIVRSIPESSRPTPIDSEASESGSLNYSMYDQAMQAKTEARIALKRAIYANGLMHKITRAIIRRGHKRIQQGNGIVLSTNGQGPAAKEFTAARALFLKAEEKAFKNEHSKPKLRVH